MILVDLNQVLLAGLMAQIANQKGINAEIFNTEEVNAIRESTFASLDCV